MTEPRKVGFPLKKDADGYPPPENEWLWACPAPDGLWVIDNIPWYARVVSLGDLVEAEADEEGQLWFRRMVTPSGHSTVRVLVLDSAKTTSDTAALRRRLEQLGCSSEQWSAEHPLLAVDLPPDVEIEALVELLDEGESQELWGWETGRLGDIHYSHWPAS